MRPVRLPRDKTVAHLLLHLITGLPKHRRSQQITTDLNPNPNFNPNFNHNPNSAWPYYDLKFKTRTISAILANLW